MASPEVSEVYWSIAVSSLKHHPKRRDLERLAKGFSRLVEEKAIEDLLITEVGESEILSRIECEDLFDGEPDVETVQVYELHENEWIPMLRKKSKRFDDLCKQFLSDYVAGVPDKPFRAALKDANEALDEAVGEYFWDEMPVELDGEWFTESYDALRDECIDEADYRRDPYRYFGVSRRDFMASSDRGALIRLASTMEKGSESRRAILAGLQKTAAVEFR